ncbi:MAG: peptidase inhibitor family I36 protein [Desulfocapsaceae bacterium]
MNTSTNPLIKGAMLSVLLIFGSFCSLASASDEVCVYDQTDWQGDRFCTEDSIRNLKDEGWNDDIASIEVDQGIEVILYEDSNFRGRSVRVMEDADHIRHGLDHAVSSLEIIRPGHENHHQSRGDKAHVSYPASQGWKLQQYCNCKTKKRCYVRQANGKREVGECLFDCPKGCKG